MELQVRPSGASGEPSLCVVCTKTNRRQLQALLAPFLETREAVYLPVEDVFTLDPRVTWEDRIPGLRPLPVPLLPFVTDARKINMVINKDEEDAPTGGNSWSLRSGVELLPHQVVAVSFFLSRTAVLFALDMGLGKTVITLACIGRSGAKRALVVVPAALRRNWEEECVKFLPDDMTVTVARDRRRLLQYIDKGCSSNVLIVSYAVLSRTCGELLEALPFDIIVADEAHFLKSQSATRTKAFLQISRVTPRRLLLTGTPVHRHVDLFQLLNILDPGTFRTFHHYRPALVGRSSTTTFFFGERYTEPELVHVGGGRKQFIFSENRRARELATVIRPYTLRMKKNAVLDLPTLRREKVVVGMLSDGDGRVFSETLANVECLRESHGKLRADCDFMELLRTTMRTKIPGVCAYLGSLLSSCQETGKFIVFAYHKEMLDAVCAFLSASDQDHIRICGGTKMKDRSGLLLKFRDVPSIRTAVLSLPACSTGLNLAFVQTTIHAELTFNSIQHIQAECRTHRIGQTKEVVQRYLILEGSTDTMVLSSIRRKNTTEATVMGDMEGPTFEFDPTTSTAGEFKPRPLDLVVVEEGIISSVVKRQRKGEEPWAPKGGTRKKKNIQRE